MVGNEMIVEVYIKGITKLGLVYSKIGNCLWLDGYVDSDYGGDKDRRISTTTYVFTLNDCCTS